MEKGSIIAKGVCFARNLGNHPGNVTTPTRLAEEARKIGRKEKVTITQGNESKVIKYKKAQPLLEDGWTLSEQ